MTVGELRALLADLPDDLIVVGNDEGGYPSDECFDPKVVPQSKAYGRYLADRNAGQLVFCLFGGWA